MNSWSERAEQETFGRFIRSSSRARSSALARSAASGGNLVVTSRACRVGLLSDQNIPTLVCSSEYEDGDHQSTLPQR